MKPFVVALGLVALWLALATSAYTGWIHGTNHRDFYPLWAGARLALFEGADLYDLKTTARTQQLLYGGRIPVGADQQGFAYPALLVPLLLPFWLIPDVEWATALWESTSVLMILLSVWLSSQTARRMPWLGSVFLLFWFYPLLMIFQAQVTAIPLLSLALGMWAWHSKRDWLAGLALVPALIKPDLTLFPLLILCLLAFRTQRWRLLTAFAAGSLLLFISSLAIAGFWPLRWFAAIGRYSDYAQVTLPLVAAYRAHILLVFLLIIVIVLALWQTVWHVNTLMASALLINMLLLPQTPYWGQTMLLLPLALCWTPRGRFFLASIWIIGWAIALLTTTTPGSWRLITFTLPTLMLIALAVASHEHPQQKSG